MVEFMLYSIKGVLCYFPNCLACIIKNSNKLQYQFFKYGVHPYLETEVKKRALNRPTEILHTCVCIFVDVQWLIRLYSTFTRSIGVQLPSLGLMTECEKTETVCQTECEENKRGNTNNKYTYHDKLVFYMLKPNTDQLIERLL